MSAHESDPEESVVHTRREGHTLFISMQRPAKRNAINRPMADGIDAALNELDDDDSLWVGVLSGTDSIFSAGSDLTCDGRLPHRTRWRVRDHPARPA